MRWLILRALFVGAVMFADIGPLGAAPVGGVVIDEGKAQLPFSFRFVHHAIVEPIIVSDVNQNVSVQFFSFDLDEVIGGKSAQCGGCLMWCQHHWPVLDRGVVQKHPWLRKAFL